MGLSDYSSLKEQSKSRATRSPLSEMHGEAFCGGCHASWLFSDGVLVWLDFFIRSLQMGDLAPFFIDMKPSGEEAD